MSKFDFRSECVKKAKNEVAQPYKVRQLGKDGKKATVATFKVEGAAAVMAGTLAQVKKAIKAGGDEYLVSVAGGKVTDNLEKGSTRLLLDADDLITNLDGMHKAAAEETAAEGGTHEPIAQDATEKV